jgi:hypothetical protein
VEDALTPIPATKQPSPTSNQRLLAQGPSSKLWKVDIPSKLRVFLWRLARHSLPTGDVRHRRNMAPTQACTICGGEDSWRHSLLDCNMAKCVWALADTNIAEHVSFPTEATTRQWLFSLFETMKAEDLRKVYFLLLGVSALAMCEPVIRWYPRW